MSHAAANPRPQPQLEVLLPTAVDRGFDYLAPAGEALSPGDIVGVPFGKGETLGVIWAQGTADLPPGKLKTIARILRFPPLSEKLRNFVDWVAWYNCAPRGAVLKMVLPIADVEKEGRIAPLASPAFTPELAKLEGIQAAAAAELAGKLGAGFSVSLLDGVTGSGKTEVYFDTIARALAADDKNQVVVLLPEIALSVQFLARFESRFGFAPVLWNSEITPARKRAGWQAIAEGSARVVVGARSALFLPYRQLALLIADEEHDSSYKQQEGVVYHARDMAVARARFEGIPVLLVSATPSLETHVNARQGKYAEISLPARHGAAQLPDIKLIDMRKTPPERGQFIAPPLRQALAETLAAGTQSLLFLNRRGYAPLVLCRGCGHRFQCSQCSAWLVLHKGRKKAGGEEYAFLACHHCGHKESLPEACPACAAEDHLQPCGPGVERLHEEVRDFLPQARVGVLASDSSGNVAELSETLEAMAKGEIDVLIGTQMVAKGHHFAGLATVGVVDADLGLAGGDLRAAEHTYQLLHQISGRAGRAQVSGTVYLQSFLPGHPVMQALLSGERDRFLAAELEARKHAQMPPFSRLAAIIVDGPNELQALKMAQALARAAPSLEGLHILGPAPAPLALLRGRYRYRLLAQASRKLNLPGILRGWVEANPAPGSIRVKIDIDPVSFM